MGERCAVTRIGHIPWRDRVRALTTAVPAAVVGLLTTGPASATVASYCDTATYDYDAPAHLSSPDTMATDARGSPSLSARVVASLGRGRA